MNISLLNTIIRHSFKLQLRNRVLHFFFFFVLTIIVYFHVRNQSNFNEHSTSGIFTLASLIPYMNAYMFSILQIIPILFVATSVFDIKKRMDTTDAIYCRPESNIEYIWGISAGIIAIFSIMSIISLVITALIHLFGSDAPFCFYNYLFYFFTLVFPTIVFTFGLSLFTCFLFRNQLFCITILLSYFGITIFYISDNLYGVFDPTGITLPNGWSEITGHPNLSEYLLQRGSWLLLGLGFIQLTVIIFERLCNNPVKRVKNTSIGSSLIFGGLALGLSFFMLNQEKKELRKIYSNTYNKYFNIPKASILHQDIKFTPYGESMKACSQLILQNQSGKKIDELVMYLNPALKVITFRVNEKEVIFDREHQVIRVHYSILPNDTLNIDIMYEGKIDENISYLDIPDDVIFNTKTNGYLACRFGKKYSFLSKSFTLLIPEVLWYPVTEPPTNPSAPFQIMKKFSNYTLSVPLIEGKEIISQGKMETDEKYVTFNNETSLSGISLCIGDYNRKDALIDSISCGLNIFERTQFLHNLETSDSLCSIIKEEIEQKMLKNYPSSQFQLIEVPITFTSYYRNTVMRSEFVQPEMVFIPERGLGVFHNDFSSLTLALQEGLKGLLLSEGRQGNLFAWTEQLGISNWNRLQFFSKFKFENNLFDIYSLFYSEANHYYIDNIPAINTILNLIIRENLGNIWRAEFEIKSQAELDAIDYLNEHSLKDALLDVTLPQNVAYKILVLKSREFQNLLGYQSISRDSLLQLISSQTDKGQLGTIDTKILKKDFVDRKEHNLRDEWATWYSCIGIPKYIIKNFNITRENSSKETSGSTLIQFDVYNAGEVDGIINLQSLNSPNDMIMENLSMSNHKKINNFYKIASNSGQRISLHTPGNVDCFRLNTGPSYNIPRQIMAEYNGQFTDKHIDSQVNLINESEFKENNSKIIIVDNEDEGCRITQSFSRFSVRNLYNRNEDNSSKYENIFTFSFLNDRWKTLVDYNAYGLYIKSVVLRMAGNGSSHLDWSTSIGKEGQYEIFVYIPQLRYDKIGVPVESETIRSPIQTYSILFPNDKKEEILVDCNIKKGWVSLGRFYCTQGTCTVSLTDRGELNQVIIGDAIKWELISSDKE